MRFPQCDGNFTLSCSAFNGLSSHFGKGWEAKKGRCFAPKACPFSLPLPWDTFYLFILISGMMSFHHVLGSYLGIARQSLQLIPRLSFKESLLPTACYVLSLFESCVFWNFFPRSVLLCAADGHSGALGKKLADFRVLFICLFCFFFHLSFISLLLFFFLIESL